MSHNDLMTPASRKRWKSPRARFTTPPESWTQWLQSRAPQIALGVGAAGLVALLAWKLYSTTPDGRARRGKGKRGGRRCDAEDASNASPRTPVGFRNTGNSCYLNALLQALQTCQPFAQYVARMQSIAAQLHDTDPRLLDPVAEGEHSAHEQLHPAGQFVTSLFRLLSPRPSHSGSGAMNPAQFQALLVREASGKFRGFDQQDAHELLHVLLDILEKQASKIEDVRRIMMRSLTADGLEAMLENQPEDAAQNGTSAQPPSAASNIAQAKARTAAILSQAAFAPLSDPFTGYLAHFLTCRTCFTASRSIRHTPFASLTLNFEGGRPELGQAPTLEDMLRALTRTETVDSVKCEACNLTARRNLLRELRDEVQALPAASGPKNARKRVALVRLIDDSLQSIFDRTQQLQSNAGELAATRAKQEADIAAYQAQFAAAGAAASPAPSSEFPAASEASSPLDRSASPPEQFLSASPSVDPLLSPRSSPVNATSAATPDYFAALAMRLTDESFTSTLPASAVARLQSVCSSDERRSFSKGAALSRLPPSLCLHLNRLMGGAHAKVVAHVAFPEVLSMRKYTAEWLHEDHSTNLALSASGRNAAAFRMHVAARAAERAAGAEDDSTTYELDAVVVHQGGGAGGHYIAYRRQVEWPRINAQQQAPIQRKKEAAKEDDTVAAASALPAPASVAADSSADSAAAPSPSAASASSSAFALDAATAPAVLPAPIVTWWFISDESYHQVDLSEVLQCQAYILVYTSSRMRRRK